MANKRLHYAVESIGFSKLGLNTFTAGHGIQQCSINTQFNLEQVFELGQLAVYENIENIPDIEVTLEKVMDGYPPLYCLATDGATSATLAGRSNTRCTVGMSLYTDTQDSASGTPLSQCVMSGLYVSQINYQIPVDGNATESLTLVGNNKDWITSSGFTFTPNFDNTDAPMAAEGVNRREDILFGSAQSLLPTDIPGISSSGTNDLGAEAIYNAHLQRITVSTNLGREQLFELGKRGPYFRYVGFPVEVRTDIEAISTAGDRVEAFEEASSNISDQVIKLIMREGHTINLGSKNKLNSVSYGGNNAGPNGGNATETYSYINFNDLTVTHPQDPSGL